MAGAGEDMALPLLTDGGEVEAQELNEAEDPTGQEEEAPCKSSTVTRSLRIFTRRLGRGLLPVV